MQGSTFSSPALGPVGLNLCRLLSILKSICPVLLGGVGCRSVAEEDVVLGLQGDGLGELVAMQLLAFSFAVHPGGVPPKHT